MDRTVRAASALLAAVGIILFALNIYFGGTLNIALPLVFLMLGGIFLILGLGMQRLRPWAAALFIPSALLLAFGVIFLLNVLTPGLTPGCCWLPAWALGQWRRIGGWSGIHWSNPSGGALPSAG